MAVFIPIPIASDNTAVTVNAELFRSNLSPYRTSCASLSIDPQPHAARVFSATSVVLPNSRRAA